VSKRRNTEARGKETRRTASQIDGATVTVCRGCCCGSEFKHPDLDHRAQLERIREGVGSAARVRVTDCLDACERSNVMVVSPSAAGRRAGARPVWLGQVLDDDATDDVIDWVTAGGPGVSEPPSVLDLYAFSPSKRVRRAVGE
jgi:(2Fe-2S) ferredoxin